MVKAIGLPDGVVGGRAIDCTGTNDSPCHVPVIVCPWSNVHIEKANPATYRKTALVTNLRGIIPDRRKLSEIRSK
jgi:hypothetical protein